MNIRQKFINEKYQKPVLIFLSVLSLINNIVLHKKIDSFLKFKIKYLCQIYKIYFK